MHSITHSSSLFYSLRYSIHRVSSLLLAMNVCIRRSCAAQQLGVRGGMHNDGPTSMRGSFHRETYVRETAKRRRCGHWSITGRRGSNRRRCRAISAIQIEFSSNSVTDLGLYVKERIDLIGKTIGPAIQYYRSLSAPTNKMINESLSETGAMIGKIVHPFDVFHGEWLLNVLMFMILSIFVYSLATSPRQ